VEGQTTSSSWAPPLWIPYGLMAAGMSLLGLQLAVQLSARVNSLRKRLTGAAHEHAHTGLLFGVVTLLFMFSGAPSRLRWAACAALHVFVHAASH